MSISSMSHVEIKKWPCRPVDFRGLGPSKWVYTNKQKQFPFRVVPAFTRCYKPVNPLPPPPAHSDTGGPVSQPMSSFRTPSFPVPSSHVVLISRSVRHDRPDTGHVTHGGPFTGVPVSQGGFYKYTF